jgi:hypothetical protein
MLRNGDRIEPHMWVRIGKALPPFPTQPPIACLNPLVIELLYLDVAAEGGSSQLLVAFTPANLSSTQASISVLATSNTHLPTIMAVINFTIFGWRS